MKSRIVYLGTPDFAVAPLETLAKDPHFEVVCVITQPDRPRDRHMKVQPSPVKECAKRLHLNTQSMDSVDREEKYIRQLGADAAVVVAFGQILSKGFLDIFPQGVVNIHSSLLPRWRGAAPMQRALMAGDTVTGVSLQKVVEKLDAGDIIGQREVSIDEALDIYTLYEALKQRSCELLSVDFKEYLKGSRVAKPQDEKKVTIARKIRKEEGEINWSESAIQICNRMRALLMWPGTWTYRQGRRLKILKARTLKSSSDFLPGTVTSVKDSSFIVSCGKGQLEIFSVQPESRSVQEVKSYLQGYPLQEGDVFSK